MVIHESFFIADLPDMLTAPHYSLRAQAFKAWSQFIAATLKSRDIFTKSLANLLHEEDERIPTYTAR